MSSSVPAQDRDAGLVRALGLRGMTFNTVNLVVGASIFVLPATVAGVLGPAAVVAYVVCAIAMAFVALCFAEAGSRTSSTGGAYIYAETAFGPFVGYLVGVVMWFGSFMLGSAGIANVLVNSVGELFPALAGRAWHNGLLVALFAGLAIANIRGVKTGAYLVEGLTVLKLAPLLLLIAVGAFAIEPANLVWPGVPSASMIANGSLVLVFAFMGIEMAVTPGGEIRDPARTVPRAILSALAIITALYIAVQVVAQGVLGAGLAESKTAPLAAVAEISLGGGGRAIILIGTIVSTFGYLAGDMLTSPRVLYAFGRDGHLPAFFGRVHPRFHSPYVAIIVHAAAAIGFALTGTFESLVVLSVVSTLIIYLTCAISVLVMRRRGIRSETPPFVTPAGPVVPILACALVVWLLSQATRAEFIAVGIMLAIAILLYLGRQLFGAASRRALVAGGVLAALAVAAYLWNPGGAPTWSVTGRLLGQQYIVVPRTGMEPALPENSSVRICFDAFHTRSAQRGDIVLFRAPFEGSGLFLKRVAAVGGEVLELRDGAVYVDGTGPLEWFHADGATVSDYSRSLVVTVPAGHVYALGDNLEHSIDSRRFGPIPTALIAGGLCGE